MTNIRASQDPNPKCKQYSPAQISIAASIWYRNVDIDSCCKAENRLMNGENPKKQIEGW